MKLTLISILRPFSISAKVISNKVLILSGNTRGFLQGQELEYLHGWGIESC